MNKKHIPRIYWFIFKYFIFWISSIDGRIIVNKSGIILNLNHIDICDGLTGNANPQVVQNWVIIQIKDFFGKQGEGSTLITEGVFLVNKKKIKINGIIYFFLLSKIISK